MMDKRLIDVSGCVGGYVLRYKGRVIAREAEVWLADAVFVVRRSGPLVRGVRTDDYAQGRALGVSVFHNPYHESGLFTTREGNRPVLRADLVYLGPTGVLAYGLRYAPGFDVREPAITARPRASLGLDNEDLAEILAGLPVLD